MNLLSMSFSGAVLILVVAVIRAAAVNKLPKKTFLVLWDIVLLRLIIPFSVPSVLSVYSLLNQTVPADTLSSIPAGNMMTYAQTEPFELTPEMAELPVNYVSAVSVLFVIWLSGMILCTAFFAISYLYSRSTFQTSLSVRNEFVKRWLEENRLKRSVSVRQSDKISAPLTYGIFKPVILMPKGTDWENRTQLEFIFLHEYVHICHYDAAKKLVSAFVLCIHWFNPFVWIMYILFQRDMELACDESVVRKSGELSKSVYARMLIDMEAKKSGLSPLCNNFSKNAVEERITAIMKIKKTSVAAVGIAAILIVGITTVFATSAAGGGEDKSVFSGTDLSEKYSEEEVDKLLALQFDGYEEMSVSEFQNRVWKLTDTEEYRNLLENFSQDTALYEQRDHNEAASFFFYTLEPLTAERWQTREFGGSTATDYSGVSDEAMLEFVFRLTVQNADTLTVGEYNAARLGVAKGLQNMLKGKTEEELQDNAFMQEAVHAEIENLSEQWSTDKLQISVEYFYQPLSKQEDGEGRQETVPQEQEKREYPNATEEDYRSLFDLKTADYRNRPVADFNMDLLEWANEDHERMERINCDVGWQDFSVDLSDDELSFVTLSTWLSGTENGKYVQSNYMGRKEEDPVYNQSLPSKTAEENGYGAWCDLFYQFSYHIPDKGSLTVGERDYYVSSMINGVLNFWNGTDVERMLSMTKEEIAGKLNEIAAECSNHKIEITIVEDSVSFEKMDERMIK